MDAVALLVADHNRVRGLFARLEAAQEEQLLELAKEQEIPGRSRMDGLAATVAPQS